MLATTWAKSFNTLYFIINNLRLFRCIDKCSTPRHTALGRCILIDIQLTPASCSKLTELCASFALAQYQVSHVTNYPALSVLISVIQSLHPCFQHVHLTRMSVWLCLVVPSLYLSVVEICKLWFTLFLVQANLPRCSFFGFFTTCLTVCLNVEVPPQLCFSLKR